MKLELQIGETLWARIEHGASLFNTTPEGYVIRLLESRAQRLPDPDAARRIAELRADAGPEDDYEIDDLLHSLERNRGRDVPIVDIQRNGVVR